MAPLDNPRSLLAAAIALILAALLPLLAGPRMKAERLANLDVTGAGVSALYIQMDPRIPGKCYATDRQGSTLRRSDDPAARVPWEFLRGTDTPDTGGLAHWLLRSKAHGAYLLVPVFAVRDWTYPYFHEFARAHGANADLPKVRWVRLFVNRIYNGLYLRVDLPSDPPGRARAGGLTRELLMVSGARMGCTDNRLSSPCTVYPALVADGKFPAPLPPSDRIRWLLSLSDVDESLLVLEPAEPYGVTCMPVPVSLREEYRLIMGEALPTVLDDRFLRWSRDGREGPEPPDGIFTPREVASLRDGWRAYREGFVEALAVHCDYHQCADGMQAAVHVRLDSRWANGPLAERRAP